MDAELTAAGNKGLETNVPVGIVGGGTMGAGIAQVAAVAGHPVRLFDSRAGIAQGAIDGVITATDKLVERQKMSVEQARKAREGLKVVDRLEEFAGCGLVIEAILEDLEAKRTLFRKLEGIVGDEAILATNTSSISITAIGAVIKHPQRLAGMHFLILLR